MSSAPTWQHTHNAHPPHTPGISIPGHYRPVPVCLDPLSGEYLTRSEWRKVYSGGTPDLPANRYRRVVPVGQ